MILRQSTAVDVLIGPFVDSTDGYTAETGVSPSVSLSKTGQALAAKNDATTPVHDANGYYNCELDATDTNTVGTLVLIVPGDATSLPVRHEFQVIEEAIYDGIYAASANAVPADVVEISGDSTAADNCELAFDGTGYGFTSCTMPVTTTVTNQVTANVAQWSGSNVATPTTAGVPEVDITFIDGSAVSTTTAQLGVNVEAWNNTAVPAAVQAGYPEVIIKTGTGSGELDIDTGTVDADVVAIGGNATSATNLSASTRAMAVLTVNTANVASTTTTAQFTGSSEATADHFIGRKLFFYDSSDALFLQGTEITDSSWDAVNSEVVLTFQQLTEAPSDGDLAILV